MRPRRDRDELRSRRNAKSIISISKDGSMNKGLKRILMAAVWLALACASPLAQVKPKTPVNPAAPQGTPVPANPSASPTAPATDGAATPPASEWISRCASEARQGSLECMLEQTAVLSKTGQLVAAVSVRVPADTHQPVMAVQVPNGLFLPAGVNLQIDEKKPLSLPLQTCDVKGCYAGMSISAELLADLKAGKKLAVTFQNLTKENITVPLQLTNFAQAYQKIQ
jgi:invasion protein IalB